MKAEQNGLIMKLTRKLMRDVYHAFTACVWLDETGEVIDLYQFDTTFCDMQCDSPRGASACLLISNHYDGCMRPFEEDMRNWRRIKAKYPALLCRLLIHSEDEGVCEIDEI